MANRDFGSKALVLLIASSCAHLATPWARAEVDPQVHGACLKAADYMGCVNVHTYGVERTERNEEQCDTFGTCIAGKGDDRHGLPKITGWKYITKEDGVVIYYEATGETRDGRLESRFYLIPHKNGKRYVGRKAVAHYYDQGAAATSGYTTSYGGGNTTCSSYGGYGSAQTFCNTSQPIRTYIPGSPGRPAGARSLSAVEVWDCRDKTKAIYEDGKRLRGNWEKNSVLPWACNEINSLPTLAIPL